MSDAADAIRAAGGVVVRNRRTPGRDPEIVVVHRARYGDWSLPKGKLDPGETEEAAALREVEEETGLRCRIVRFVQTVRYADRRGRPKTVAYWLMEPVDGELRADHEIDDVRWARAADVASVLTYPRDVEVVEASLANGSGA
jgi:8-oxo-dGTP pyrophosphatase MutT (NUDIX family)